MLAFPHAKINLGLNVLRRREDGYHDIRSILLPIPLCDVLEVIADPGLGPGEVVMTHSGSPIPGDPGRDLCIQAARTIGRARQLPGVRIHLHKVIPVGGGLGGGSSDAAHTLVLMNWLFDLGLPLDQLRAIAAELGSDCPFFLSAAPQLAEGRGEVLRSLELPLNGWHLVLVNPGIHVSTAEAYARWSPSSSAHGLELAWLQQGPQAWQDHLVNDLEPGVIALHPRIGEIKKELLRKGATYAGMSGSGATVFAFFKGVPPVMQWPQGHWQWHCAL